MDTTIKVENLSKSYLIGHQKREHYVTFRDVLAHQFRSMGQRIRRPLSMNKENIQQEEFWALKDINLEVKKGERIGIIGKNGAGKSTLLKVLSRITLPTKGSFVLQGRVASLLEVGTGFHQELTGRENIFLNGAVLGMKRNEIKKKFDEIVDFAEIEKFLDTPVKRYSSGMYVRLAFAVAAHLDTEILIVDEVLAVGDHEFQKKSLGKMEDISKSHGKTLLFVSHNTATVKALCNRTIILDSGKITMDDRTDRAVSEYLLNQSRTVSAADDLSMIDRPSYIRETAILRAWLENKDGDIITEGVRMGDGLFVCMYFKSSQLIKAPGFGFTVDDLEGRTVFAINNHMVPDKSTRESVKSGVAKLYIPRLPLVKGRYFVTFSLTTRRMEYIDRVEKALPFFVHEDDVYGSGVIPMKKQGVVFIDGNITFSADDSFQGN